MTRFLIYFCVVLLLVFIGCRTSVVRVSQIDQQDLTREPKFLTREALARLLSDSLSDYLPVLGVPEGEEGKRAILSMGILPPAPDGNFYPCDSLTRMQLCLVVYRVLSKLPTDVSCPPMVIKDVDATEFYYRPVCTVCALEIMGLEDGCFFPQRKVSFEEGVAVVRRLKKFLGGGE